MKITDILPDLKKLEKYEINKYQKIFEDVYKKREKKSGKKAIYSAKAAVLFELNKELNEVKTKKIRKIKIVKKYDGPYYTMNGYKIILTKDFNDSSFKKFIKNFDEGNILYYGKLNHISTEFAKEIIFKLLTKYDLNIDKNFYYLIWEPSDEVA